MRQINSTKSFWELRKNLMIHYKNEFPPLNIFHFPWPLNQRQDGSVLDFGSLQAGQTTSVYYRGLNVTWRKNVREKFASIFANYYALGLECHAVMQHCAMR